MFSYYKAISVVLGFCCLSSMSLALNDPTKPASYRIISGAKESLRLESIFLGDARKVAVINGSVVTEGDRIGDTKILRINKDSVKVTRGGIASTLEMKRTSIRQEK